MSSLKCHDEEVQSEINKLKTKKDILKLAAEYGIQLQKNKKLNMKSELQEKLKHFKIKTVKILLEESDEMDGRVLYKGTDNIFYNSEGEVMHEYMLQSQNKKILDLQKKITELNLIIQNNNDKILHLQKKVEELNSIEQNPMTIQNIFN